MSHAQVFGVLGVGFGVSLNIISRLSEDKEVVLVSQATIDASRASGTLVHSQVVPGKLCLEKSPYNVQ